MASEKSSGPDPAQLLRAAEESIEVAWAAIAKACPYLEHDIVVRLQAESGRLPEHLVDHAVAHVEVSAPDQGRRSYEIGVCSLCASDDIMSNTEDSYCNECKHWMSAETLTVVGES